MSCPIERDSVNTAHLVINNHLSNIYKWTCANKIKINVDKTKFIIFSYRKEFHLSGPIVVGNEMIQQTDSVKFLGIILDQNLNFSLHVHSVASKLSRVLGLLNRLRRFFPLSVMLSLYYSLIYPHITYGVEVWYSAAPKYVIREIEVLQRKVVRILCNLEYNAHTSHHFTDMGILTLKSCFEFGIILHTFKTLQSSGFDRNLSEKLISLSDYHGRNTRGGHKFLIPRFNLVKSNCHVLYCAVKLWNDLPSDIVRCNSLISLKRKLKNHFIINQ